MPRARSCKPPASIRVKGHWRQVRKTRKKKRAARAPSGPYWAAVSRTTGAKCGHHHRTSSGAARCARQLGREARARHARYSTRKNKLKLERFDIDKFGG